MSKRKPTPFGVTWPYRLRRGHSDDPSEGACAMDAVNWLVHGQHGDEPACACPLIGCFVIRGNDGMPPKVRQNLLTYLPRIAGSRSPEHAPARLRMMVLAAARVFAAAAMDAARLPAEAARLRAIPDDASYRDIRDYAARTLLAPRCLNVAWRSASAAAAAAEWACAWENSVPTSWREAAAYAAAAASPLWTNYFLVLDAVLAAGPQGEPWSADATERAVSAFVGAGGIAKLLTTA